MASTVYEDLNAEKALMVNVQSSDLTVQVQKLVPKRACADDGMVNVS